MENNATAVSPVEMKDKIKNYFVEVKEDKFTKVKVVKSIHEIEWKREELSGKFMLTENESHILKLKIDYRHKEEMDSVFFVFVYQDADDGYPNMNNIEMYLILDDNKTIELKDASGFEHTSKTMGSEYIYTMYFEIVQLAVPVPDMIAIANANKIEYSIRFGQGKLDGTFTNDQMNIFKGFYNSTFDEDFEVDKLYIAATTAKPKVVAGGSKGSCYIATMAYGSYEHPQVLILRSFRDNYLASNKWGKRFISFYYKHSPKLVEKLKNQMLINKTIRKVLDLFIRFIK